MKNWFLELFKSGDKAHLVHLHGDDMDGVACAELRVVIKRDKEFWYAQGVEINYLAQGNSLEEVKQRFRLGLISTVRSHIERYGNLKNLLKWADESVWKNELHTAYRQEFTEIFDKTDMKHQLSGAFPFGVLKFNEPQTNHR